MYPHKPVDLLENAFEIFLFENKIQEGTAGKCMSPVDLDQKIVFCLAEDQFLRLD